MMDKLVIGKIINTRGLKGEVKVNNYSSFVKNRYKVGNIVYLSNNEIDFIEKSLIRMYKNIALIQTIDFSLKGSFLNASL